MTLPIRRYGDPVLRAKGRQIATIDDHVRELWWDLSGWHENVLTQTVSGAPLSAGDPTGYSFETQKTQHVVYRAPDDRLRELWWSGEGWHLSAYELASPYADPIGPLITPFFYEDQDAPNTFFVEPSLAEKTVHDWNEYVVTTEEYVADTVKYPPVRVKPYFPEKIAIRASDDAMLSPNVLPPDPLLDDGYVLVTKKGAFDAGGGVRGRASSEVTGSFAGAGVRVLDATRGFANNVGMLDVNVNVGAGFGGGK